MSVTGLRSQPRRCTTHSGAGTMALPLHSNVISSGSATSAGV